MTWHIFDVLKIVDVRVDSATHKAKNDYTDEANLPHRDEVA
ncbi:MAG TPA: hypothetical protein V6D09_12250 [Leptolyngbyaceae cyanobacterium]